MKYQIYLFVPAMVLCALFSFSQENTQAQSESIPERNKEYEKENIFPNEKESLKYVPGEIIVKYREEEITLSEEKGKKITNRLLEQADVQVKESMERGNIEILAIKDTKTVEEKIKELEEDSLVEYAEPNYTRYLTAIDTDDTHKDLLWGLDNFGQNVHGTSGFIDADIDASEAWSNHQDLDNDVIVAVIDNGVAYNHPDLLSNMWDGSLCKDENGNFLGGCLYGYDFSDDDKDPLPAGTHGTHVSGIIGATRNNGIGILGVAPRVKIMALRFGLDVASEVKAIDFAIQNGVKVINASYGSDAFSLAEYEAISRFSDSGGIFVAASGNNGSSNENNHFYPSDYDLDAIISVAATDQNDEIASFSNYGNISVDVGAPGVNIYSVVPEETSILNETFNGLSPPNIPLNWSKTGDWGSYNFSGDTVLYGDVSPVPYEKNVNATITSDVYDLSGGQSSLSFFTQCDTEYSLSDWTDYMSLEISSDGSSFSEFLRWDEVYLDSDSNDAGSASYFFDELSIPQNYLTNTFRFRFRWVTNGNGDTGSTGDGCMIDDIAILKYTDGANEVYDYANGTSMATPYVSGIVASLYSNDPSISSSRVKSIVLHSGDPLPSGSDQGKLVSGKRVNLDNALFAMDDVTPPILLEVTPIATPTSDTTPDYTFSSNEEGVIAYEGDCTSDTTQAIVGNNTITFSSLSGGEYTNCAIRVTDFSGNESDILHINPFVVIAKQPLYRFWSDQKQGHFFTASKEERDFIIVNYFENVWRYEGEAYSVYSYQIGSLSPIYRFWSDEKQHHFYTISEAEKNHVIATYPESVWKYEGIAYYAYPAQESNTKPVYRFWSDQKQGHFYTSSLAEKDSIIANYPENVWKYEGIAWYVSE